MATPHFDHDISPYTSPNQNNAKRSSFRASQGKSNAAKISKNDPHATKL